MAAGPRRFLCLFLAGFVAAWSQAHAGDSLPEYHVKAGYLFHFTKYVEWPAETFPSATSPIFIGVLGEDPFGALLENTVRARTSQDRLLVIRRARRVEELQGCQLIFICPSEAARAPDILASLRDTPVVTVCDLADIFDQGAMVQLTLVDQTVQFEVRLGPATRAGLRFNSRMLAAARRVWRETGAEKGIP